MKQILPALRAHRIGLALSLLFAVAAAFGAAFGTPDMGAAAVVLAMGAALPADEILQKALAEHGVQLKKFADRIAEFNVRIMDLEQKGVWRPSFGLASPSGQRGELTQTLMNSAGLKAYVDGVTKAVDIPIPHALIRNAAIVGDNPSDNPLVAPDRSRAPVAPALRRLTIRDLFSAVPTSSNMIEFPRETLFTNNAEIQGAGASPSGQYEGQPKAEPNLTFELASVRVPTIAHWIPASFQVLADAPLLQRYVEGRLMYGLKLKEEDEFLNGTGTGGHIEGLVAQATAYAMGASSDTRIDTLAKAIVQLALTEHMCTGFILNPQDWLKIILEKDNEGRYIFGNPAQMTVPQLWGVPVVVTNTMTAGNFVALDAPMAGYVADREDATIRISESHGDFFIRNLVAIRCEERSTLVIERPAAILHGALFQAV